MNIIILLALVVFEDNPRPYRGPPTLRQVEIKLQKATPFQLIPSTPTEHKSSEFTLIPHKTVTPAFDGLQNKIAKITTNTPNKNKIAEIYREA